MNQSMQNLRTSSDLPKAAQHFIRGVSALVFALVLAFAGWVIVSAVQGGGATPVIRLIAGVVIAVGAVTLLASLRDGWRSGEELRRSRKAVLGFAILAVGMCTLVAG
jgi:hypothetical protein